MHTGARFAATAALFAVSLAPAAGQDKAGEKYKLVRYKEVQTTEMKDGFVGESTTTIYADLKTGANRRETKIADEVHLQVQDPTKQRLLMTNSAEKSATLFPLDPKRKITPLLEFQRAFHKTKGVTATEEDLGGRKTMKYVLKEKGRVYTLWMDAKTNLPVREELELSEPVENPQIKRNTFAFSDYEWDPDVKDADQLFSTDPPKGYTVEDKTQKGK